MTVPQWVGVVSAALGVVGAVGGAAAAWAKPQERRLWILILAWALIAGLWAAQ